MLKSNFKETKFYFENLFLMGWKIKDTPIHWVGQEFDASGVSKWINIMYSPFLGKNIGIDGNMNSSEGTFHVICWASNDVDVMELGDNVVEFLSKNSDDMYNLKNYAVEEHGWSDDKHVFLQLSFTINSLFGCDSGKPLPPTLKAITNNGFIIVDSATGNEVVN